MQRSKSGMSIASVGEKVASLFLRDLVSLLGLENLITGDRVFHYYWAITMDVVLGCITLPLAVLYVSIFKEGRCYPHSRPLGRGYKTMILYLSSRGSALGEVSADEVAQEVFYASCMRKVGKLA